MLLICYVVLHLIMRVIKCLLLKLINTVSTQQRHFWIYEMAYLDAYFSDITYSEKRSLKVESETE